MESLLEILIHCGEHFEESFVVADLREKDQPLVYINDAFAKLTGYQKQEIVGKNCRFLQGDLSNRETIGQLKKAIAARECCFYDLLNYKKNGVPFWNRLVLFPIGYSEDDIAFYVGIQINIFEGENAIQTFDIKSPKGETERAVKNPFDRIIQAQRAMKYAGFSDNETLSPAKLATEIIGEVLSISRYLKNV
jgi:two-component system, sensor histidine kinase